MPLFECGSCRRHVRAHESSCPFCGLARVTIAVATAAMVAGCGGPSVKAMYGGPPIDVSPRVDAGDSDSPTSTTTTTTTTTTTPDPAPTTTPATTATTNPSMLAPAYGGPPPGGPIAPQK